MAAELIDIVMVGLDGTEYPTQAGKLDDGKVYPVQVLVGTDGQPILPPLDNTLQDVLTKLGAVELVPGTAIIGKVAVDQSAPGVSNATVVGVLDSTGGMCFPDNFAHTLTWNTDGALHSDSFTDGAGHTWTQTMTVPFHWVISNLVSSVRLSGYGSLSGVAGG